MKNVLRSNLSVKKFDTDFTRKFFEAECREIFKAAAVEFVQTAAANVPSLTGQAKAALIAIATKIGVDPGVHHADPPESDNLYQLIPLVLAGNTPERGTKMGGSKLRTNTKSVTWTITLDITAAHNGFEYFTYWDNHTWHSLEQAGESALKYVQGHFTDAIKLRTNLNGR